MSTSQNQPNEPSQWALEIGKRTSGSISAVARALDAATAQRDAEIERLREELEAKKRIIARSDSEIDRLMDRMERIAQLEALLESQRHNHNEISYYGRLANIESAKKLCLACQYEALKKEQP